MVDTVQLDICRQVCEAQENWTRKYDTSDKATMPFITLTYAQSIDGSLAAERGSLTEMDAQRQESTAPRLITFCGGF
ncbi:hypothetical protein P3T76_002811 [Phytophthora citrophthora]|uniref:Uncharacterized protein n=1 Tax=Phytophthora citrophthora TaxID=4793 RepID=A0AAD9GX32_9STRA|nr:hypothetical protein P3T76_002811 [Phytophthora citrophthora]